MEKTANKSNGFTKAMSAAGSAVAAWFPRFLSGAKESFKHMGYAFYILFHPFDGFFDLKNDPKRRSVSAGVLWLIVYAVVAIIRRQTLGYLFTSRAVQLDLNVVREFLSAILPFVLWAVANWCFSSLMDGDGKLSDVFMATCFATVPITLCNLVQIPLSHFLSSSEQSVFTFIGSLGLVWGYFYMFLSMITVHQYSVGKGIWTTVLTILGMAVIVFIAILVFFLVQQVSSFFIQIGTEIIFRLNE